MHASRSDLSILPTSHQDQAVTYIYIGTDKCVLLCRWVLSALTSTCHHPHLKPSTERVLFLGKEWCSKLFSKLSKVLFNFHFTCLYVCFFLLPDDYLFLAF